MSLETIRLQELGLDAGNRVLDLGCGEGRHAISASLSADVQVIGIDINVRDLATARERSDGFESEHDCQFLVASGFALPFADDAFDRVICSEVLEHIHDYEAVLTEIRRVLKPSGKLAVSVPRFFPEQVCWWLSDEYHQVEGGHIRIFRSRRLRNAVESRGFVRTSRHWAHALHVPYWWLRCLQWSQGERAPLARIYHKLLVWDLMTAPWITRSLDRILNPIMGKSVVMYFEGNQR